MSVDLEHRPVPALPAGYHVVRRHTDDVAAVEVRADDGSLAASGQAGLGVTYAVPDLIVTQEAHRRRGLGSVLMLELLAEARARGRRRAVLGASADGRELYRRLGWVEESPLVGLYHDAGAPAATR